MRHGACPAALAPRRRCRLCRRSPSRARPLFTPVSTARTGSAPDYGCWYCPLRPVREDTTLCHLACSGLPTALGETAAAEGKGPRRPRKRENGVIATRNPRRRRQRLEGTERTRPKRGPAGRTPDRAHAYGPEGGARGPGPRRGSQGSRRGRKNRNRVSRAGGPSTRRRFHSCHLSGLGGYVLGGRLGQGKGPLSGQRGRDAAPPAPPGPAVRQLPAPPRAREEGALHLPPRPPVAAWTLCCQRRGQPRLRPSGSALRSWEGPREFLRNDGEPFPSQPLYCLVQILNKACGL